MINRDMIVSASLLVLCQILVWFQTNGSLRVEWLKNNIWLLALCGIPITYLYVLATQIGYKGFGNLWAIRVISFGAGLIVFTILTSIFFGEPIGNAKTILTVILMTSAIAIQIFWK